VTGVEDVRPLHVNSDLWRNPDTGEQRRILMVGFDPRKPPFRLPEVRAQEQALTRADTVLIDRLTRPEYGPQTSGVVAELRRRRLRIVGQYTLGTGLGADGAVMMSDETFDRVFGRDQILDVSVGLIRLAASADARV
jgi:putative ABC transport system permease protein